MEKSDLCKLEIENLTGKIFSGDPTPLVFNLVKDSTKLLSLYNELSEQKLVDDEEVETTNIQSAMGSFEDLFNSATVIG